MILLFLFPFGKGNALKAIKFLKIFLSITSLVLLDGIYCLLVSLSPTFLSKKLAQERHKNYNAPNDGKTRRHFLPNF